MSTNIHVLPTRQQLEKFLQSKGKPSAQLGRMSSLEQVHLAKECQRWLEQFADEQS